MRVVRRGAGLALLAVLLAAAAAAQPAAAFDPDLPELCNTREFKHFKVQRSGQVRVLYKSRATRKAARRIAKQAGGRIYPKFKKLLGRVPPSDKREGCFHGPDGKLDIYVTRAKQVGHIDMPKDVVAFAHPFDPDKGCDPKQPVFLLVKPNVRNAVLAHEMFHAFAAAYRTAEKCEEYGPWEEAMATWGGNYVYPRDNVEHDHPGAIERPDVYLPYWGYATWVFPYYVTQKFGTRYARLIEEAKERYKADDFVDRAIPGGFAVRFPEFSLYAYNQAPVPTVLGAGFRQWDAIAHVPKSVPVTDPRLAGAHTRTDALPITKGKLLPLGREYKRIVLADSSIRQVQFINPNAANRDLHVRALVKRADDAWRSEVWDGKPTVSFCRDQPGQDVREIVLAYSNSAHLVGHSAIARTSLRSEDTCALHYKVLRASINYHTDAHADDVLCGTQSGRITFTASGGPQAYDPDNSIATHSGQVSGEIGARIPGGAWSGHHLEGCSLSPSPKHACSVDMPTRPVLGDGLKPISFSISGGANDPTWEMRWGMDDPEVGFVDAGDDECNVHIWGYFDDATQIRTVPRATMLGTAPVTLVFTGSGVAPHTPNNDNATVSHSWTYSMTIQRVGADGMPLG